MWKSAGRAPSLRVLPWHLPYNGGKKHGKTSVRVRKTSVRLRKTSLKVQYAYYQIHPHISVIVSAEAVVVTQGCPAAVTF